ncbi:MAG: hypothetical protein IT428_00985 [Planctomycetaceae bacterium]|nr:hypothetical protein [Planctomycetaceae bacterium]
MPKTACRWPGCSMRKRHLTRLAATAVALFLIAFWAKEWVRPLTPDERMVVGTWAKSDDSGVPRYFVEYFEDLSFQEGEFDGGGTRIVSDSGTWRMTDSGLIEQNYRTSMRDFCTDLLKARWPWFRNYSALEGDERLNFGFGCDGAHHQRMKGPPRAVPKL